MTTVHLARHGETVWHEENRYAGSSDVALTDRGRLQAEMLATAMAARDIAVVASSDLTRARETAAPAARRLGLEVVVDPRLREVDYGDAEGLTATEIRARWPDAWDSFVATPATTPLPGGEPGADAVARYVAALSDLAEAAAVAGGELLVVAHSTAIRMLLCRALGLPLDEYRRRFPRLDNGAVIEGTVEPGGALTIASPKRAERSRRGGAAHTGEFAAVRAFGRRLVSSLPTKANPDLADALMGQLQAARDGAALAELMVAKEITPAAAREQVAAIERRGDEMRGVLVGVLSKTLVAPLDREDLFRLSRAIDDVLDTIRDFVWEAELYQIDDRSTYRPFLASVLVAIGMLEEAVEALWSGPHGVPMKALATKKAARAINREYREEFARIVGGEMSPAALKKRELIKRLDWVGVRISDAADVLTDGALKRGY